MKLCGVAPVNHSIRKLLSTTWQTVESWFAGDRIRIAPSAGRLLSLRAGDTFMLLGIRYSITQRTVMKTGNGHEVLCRLACPAGPGELQIRYCPVAQGPIEARFVVDSDVTIVFDDDVFIVQPE
jgi:hypothetical protein